MPARLLAVCAGSIQSFGRLKTAIQKSALSSLDDPRLIAIQRLGVEGDEQAESGIHGGPDKAIYMAPVEHWAFWQQQRTGLGITEAIDFGFMGENMSVEGLSEDEVYAGDHLRIGPVILKVTEPRTPCLKFNRRMGYAKAAKQMIQSGRSGWYCAVLQTGFVAAGELVELIPGRRLVSIADQLRMQQRSLERQIELF